MKANEFVKKFGLEKCKELLKKAEGCDGIRAYSEYVLYADLKRLVESHELVEKVGGIDRVKLRRYSAKYLAMGFYHRLKQATADVESCMEPTK